MNSLAVLICLAAAAAQGGGNREDDRRVLAAIGLQAVGRELVDVRAPTAPRTHGGRPGIRQGGPVCSWWLLNLADFFAPDAGELPALPPPGGVYAAQGSPLDGIGLGFGSLGGAVDYAALVPPLGGLLDQKPGTPLLPIGATDSPATVTPPSSATPVPEPGALAILSAPALALIFIVRRRRQKGV